MRVFTAALFMALCLCVLGSGSAFAIGQQLSTLTATGGAVNDYFGGPASGTSGNSVAVSGNLAVVGAFQADIVASGNEGAVYVYDMTDPANPSPAGGTKITASDAAASDYFGASVAVSGNLLVVGALNKTIGANASQGAVYVYDISTPTAPQFRSRPVATGGAANDYFGNSVAISGTTALVGSYTRNASTGAVYVLDLTTPAAPTQVMITAGDGASGDRFGKSVAISGNLAVIGAYTKTVSGHANQGAAYVYDVSNPAAPVFKTKLTSSDGLADDYFGQSVSISGTVAVVGAYGADIPGSPASFQGAAYVYDLSTLPAAMTETKKITAPDAAQGDQLGYNTAMSGKLVVLGAFGAKIGSKAGQGAIYMYDLTDPANPVQKAKLWSSDGLANDAFGISVAMTGNIVMAGAPIHKVGANVGQGAAYVFNIQYDCLSPPKTGSAGEVEYIAASHKYQYCNGTSWIDLPVNATVAACASDSELEFDTGLNNFKYCNGTNYKNMSCTPDCSISTNWATAAQKAEITASNGAASDKFGDSVAMSGNLMVVGASGKDAMRGAAYVYDVSDPANPVQRSILTASDGVAGDLFGVSVSVSGNIAVVGANAKTIGANSWQGAAYVFDLTNPSAPSQVKITASDGVAGDQFGVSVSVSGGLAVVGAEASLTYKGAAYVFDVSTPSAPLQKTKLTASDGAANDHLGGSVSISGTLAIAGARCKPFSNCNGAAYVFDLSTLPASKTQVTKLTASDTATSDYLGTVVAISGTVAVVTAPGDAIGSNSSQGSAYVFDLSTLPASKTQASKITASDGDTSEYYGDGVSISGNTVVVGASQKHDLSTGAVYGAAYMYDITSLAAPVQKSKFMASDGVSGDKFGISVAMSGGTVVVGANNKTVGSNLSQGAAYVFTSGCSAACAAYGAPVEKSKLTASDGAASDMLGQGVAVSGNIAVVGAWQAKIGTNTLQGAAYMYDVSTPSAPVQKSKLTSSDGAQNDGFGNSVALSGTLAVVGAGANLGKGAAYVYNLSGTPPASMTQTTKLTASDGVSGDYFGASVSVSGTLAVAGAQSAGGKGAAYVFDLSTLPASKTQVTKLTASDGAANDYFGSSISISGTLAVVGAPYKTGGGAAYVYDLSTLPASKTETKKIIASDAAASDQFGSSVSISGNIAVVGAPNKTIGTNAGQGAAYVFDLTNLAAPTQVRIIASDGAASDQFGYSVSVLGTLALIGAQSAGGKGAAYLFDVSTPSAPVQKSKLTASDGLASDFFGRSVAILDTLAVVGAAGDDIGANSGQGSAYVFSWNCTTTACSTNGSCASQQGALDYNTSSNKFQYCNGTNWTPLGPCAEVSSLSFPSKHGLNCNETYVNSNIVQIPATAGCDKAVSTTGGGQFRICSDAACATEVVTWGSTNQIIKPGQYVQQRLMTPMIGPGCQNTVPTSTLTVGAYTAPAWSLNVDRLVFVSSLGYNGKFGGAGGVAAADAQCTTRATSAGLPGTYKAWVAITTGTDDPATVARFYHAPMPYVLVDGTRIANDWTDLTDGTLAGSGISEDELGNPAFVGAPVWTNVAINGTATTSGGASPNGCVAWGSTVSSKSGTYGLIGSTNAAWTASGSTTPCNGSLQIYCFQQ